MSFSELPEEMLVETLLQLSYPDIVNACQTNLQFAQVCNRKMLWYGLLKRDFPDVAISDIADPRAFYFQLKEAAHNWLR